MKATWSDDTTLTTRINPAVAHYTGQTELASAIQEGLAAKAAGDEDTATHQARAGGAARGRDRRRRGDEPAEEGGRHRGRRDRHRAPEGEGVEARRDGARHQLDQDDPGALMTYTCPQGHQSSHRRLLRRLRRPHRRGARRRRAAPRRAAPPTRGAARRRRRAVVARPCPTRRAATRRRCTCPNCGDREPGRRAVLRGVRLRLHDRPAAHAGADRLRAAARRGVGRRALDRSRTGSSTRTAPGGCATSGAPTVVPLRATTVTIGRRSKSRNLAPDLDCSGDGAVSHEHATLTLDHDRWYVEDLGSTNGTFVGAPGEPLPDDTAAAAATARARRRRADLRRRLDPHHGAPRDRQREGRRNRLTQTQKRADASVRTVRSTSVSSSSSASPATSGGASWTTGSPRSSARAINPDS